MPTMSANKSIETTTEYCQECDQETDHSVSVTLVTESDKERNAEFSREPYRVSECRECGSEQKTRMNNA